MNSLARKNTASDRVLPVEGFFRCGKENTLIDDLSFSWLLVALEGVRPLDPVSHGIQDSTVNLLNNKKIILH